MARITVEDCLQNVDNLFQLVLVASKRARRLANGAEATVDWENDKATVVALREIAAGNITSALRCSKSPSRAGAGTAAAGNGDSRRLPRSRSSVWATKSFLLEAARSR